MAKKHYSYMQDRNSLIQLQMQEQFQSTLHHHMYSITASTLLTDSVLKMQVTFTDVLLTQQKMYLKRELQHSKVVQQHLQLVQEQQHLHMLSRHLHTQVTISQQLRIFMVVHTTFQHIHFQITELKLHSQIHLIMMLSKQLSDLTQRQYRLKHLAILTQKQQILKEQLRLHTHTTFHLQLIIHLQHLTL